MKLQKIASLVLALVMIFSLGITAFADDETVLGSITINGVSVKDDKPEATYSIYRLLDLESYNTAGEGAYSYKVNSDWKDFFKTDEALQYVSIDASGYVTWNKTKETEADYATFAKGALSYAKEKEINPVKTSETVGDFTVTGTSGVFEDLPFGYYLIDTTMGALCGLTTTNPHASLNAKNGKPTLDLQVEEDSTLQYGKKNTAEFGQTINFRATINVHAGAQNYVFHDKLGDGFTFDELVKIEHVSGTGTQTVSSEKYELVTIGLENGETFVIGFTKEFCDELATNDKVIIHYRAHLDENAVVEEVSEASGNPNTATLSFGEGFSTAPSVTTTETFFADIIKTDSQNTLLDGAEFKVYDLNGTNETLVKFVVCETEADDNSVATVYRRAIGDEADADVVDTIVVADGQVRIIGFDNGNYALEETVAPKGYNKLNSRQSFTISDDSLDAIFNGDVFSTGSGVHVVNKTGSMLPETGGIGTTIFYVVGGLLVGGAVVALVSKKRMSDK